jgi:ATP-dependent RNA helicase DDX27
MDDDFVYTISDREGSLSAEEEVEFEPIVAVNGKKRKHAASNEKARNKKQKKQAPVHDDSEPEDQEEKVENDEAIAPEFVFDTGETTTFEEFDGWGLIDQQVATRTGNINAVDIDDIVARRVKPSNGLEEDEEDEEDEDEEQNEEDEEAQDDGSFDGVEDDEMMDNDAFGMGVALESTGNPEGDEENGADSDGDEQDDAQDSDGSVAAHVPHPMDLESDSDEDRVDAAEMKRRTAFFAKDEVDSKAANVKSFLDLSLSRPIMKGLTAIGFSEPTPIQEKTIPVALMGKDVVGGAVTGSGKTAAFLVPILERLLYRPKRVATTRVAILMPTRELAVQCFNVAKKIASFTDITFAQIVGGFSLREQEQVLKKRPDVVIATPGRFIDHMRNSPSFAVDTLEILVLDEADRMLEDGFAEELNEILNTIPKSRQTMLFSATMTEDVDKLIRLGMTRPVRLLVDNKKSTVSGLIQEFIRLRPGREEKRLAYLVWLVQTVYLERTIVFFRQKKEAHRVRVIFALLGIKASELHGSMSQEQRIQAVEKFRTGAVEFLLATDLASRGLDIRNVSAVINYEAPQTHEIYLHRVGRTARAGKSGKACTLAAEPDRKIVKAVVRSAKKSGGKIVSRMVPLQDVDDLADKLDGMADEVTAVLADEREEKALTVAERDLKKGENLVIHKDEIMARPKRTWFETEKDKKASKDKGRVELNGELDEAKNKKIKKGKKLSGKEKKKLEMKDERKEGRLWGKTKDQRGVRSFKKNGASGKGKKPSTKAR